MRTLKNKQEIRTPGALRMILFVTQCFFLLSGLSGSASAQGRIPANRPPSAAAPLPPPITGPYRIQVGDELNVRFFKVPELDQSVIVGPDGEISLTLLGPVKAAGSTLLELTDSITQGYKKQLVEPEITLSVRKFAGMNIFIGGEVNNPGMLPYEGGLTLVQAIMRAGGFNATARLTEVLLIRSGPDREPVGVVIDVREILYEARFANDQALAPYDVIFVPRSKIANVNLFIEQYIKNNIPIPISIGFYRP